MNDNQHVDVIVTTGEEPPPKLGRRMAKVAFVIGLALALFQVRTGIAGPFGDLIQGAIHLGFVFVLCFLFYPTGRRLERGRQWGNSAIIFVVGGLAATALMTIIIEAVRVYLGLANNPVPTIGWYFIGPVLAAVLYLPARRAKHQGILPVDIVLMILAVVVTVYTMANYDRILESITVARPMDYLVGTSLMLLMLEAGRRVVGWPLVIMAALLLIYTLTGEHIPGRWGHPPISITTALYSLYLAVTGLYGPIVRLSATLVGIVVVFGGLLVVTGTGQSFMDLALAAAGKSKGGPAKVSVISSSLFGMISGSATANVAITGNFTIPLMKSVGYPAEFAAGTEATASTGGHVMPPIMATSAFLMAEFLGVSYLKVIVAATLPAIAYYLAVFLVVHLTAVKGGLPGVPPERVPQLRAALQHRGIFSLAISIAVLLFLLFRGYPIVNSIFWAIMVVMGLYLLMGDPRKIPSRIVDLVRGLENGARLLLPVATIIALAQMMVSLLGISGIGVKFAQLIASVGETNLMASLVISAILAILLGMGMPPIAAYVLCVGVVVPGLITLGLPPLLVHMYVFHFTSMATITPPVCAAVYVAAGMAGCSWVKAAGWAMRLGFAGLTVPLVFAYRPGLLFIGGPVQILHAIVIVFLGIVAWSFAITGYASRSLSIIERLIFFAGGLLLFVPEVATNVAGGAVVAATYLWQRFHRPGSTENSALKP
ncbi:TRAP transporter permease [Chloroflexota bacterium]